MPETSCEKALERVLIYLRLDGQVLTTESCHAALRLVEEAISHGDGPDLPGRCIELIPEYFDTRTIDIPASAPPLKRGHLGYFRDE